MCNQMVTSEITGIIISRAFCPNPYNKPRALRLGKLLGFGQNTSEIIP